MRRAGFGLSSALICCSAGIVACADLDTGDLEAPVTTQAGALAALGDDDPLIAEETDETGAATGARVAADLDDARGTEPWCTTEGAGSQVAESVARRELARTPGRPERQSVPLDELAAALATTFDSASARDVAEVDVEQQRTLMAMQQSYVDAGCADDAVAETRACAAHPYNALRVGGVPR